MLEILLEFIVLDECLYIVILEKQKDSRGKKNSLFPPGPVIISVNYYVALFHKDWKIPNSRISLTVKSILKAV